MKNKYLYIIVGVLLLGITTLGITFGYLSASKKQELANSFTVGCLNIEIEDEGSAIDIPNAVAVTDVKGLDQDGYTFTIHNTCNKDSYYQINLEELSDPSLNTTLNANHLRVALSSDTFDNIITNLGENTEVTAKIKGAYKAYNLYNGSIEANSTKSFVLKEWIEYNTTKEEGTNKQIKTKINVTVGDNINNIDNITEIKFDKTTGKITGTITSNIKYCTIEDNKCIPETSINATNKQITVDLSSTITKIITTTLGNLEVHVNSKQIICTSINGSKEICSNPINVEATHFDGTSCIDTDCTYQENGIYEAEDENGTTSYYFRGTVENNYVKFGKDKNNADIWWRIIRINGDGSIRMIYAGTSTTTNAPAQTGAGTMIGSYKFNNSSNQAEYVGYQYTYTLDAPVRNGHITDSNAKIELEKWFANNLLEEYEEGYIDKNAGFCGDRTAYDYTTKVRNDSLGTGTQKTYYGGYIRTTQIHEPTFLCEDKEHDLYTVQEAKEGTQSLTYPIGLTTIDEQVYAGNHRSGSNTKYYLYNNQYYWTMSPYSFDGSVAYVFRVGDNGHLYGSSVVAASGLRPVLNLVSGTLNAGSGTVNDPFSLS